MATWSWSTCPFRRRRRSGGPSGPVAAPARRATPARLHCSSQGRQPTGCRAAGPVWSCWNAAVSISQTNRRPTTPHAAPPLAERAGRGRGRGQLPCYDHQSAHGRLRPVLPRCTAQLPPRALKTLKSRLPFAVSLRRASQTRARQPHDPPLSPPLAPGAPDNGSLPSSDRPLDPARAQAHQR